MIKFKNSSSIEINILKLMGAIGLLAAGFFFAKIMMWIIINTILYEEFIECKLLI